MGWVTAAGDDLILVELKWWETFSSLYPGQGRSGNKSRELTAQRKKHSGPQCSPEGSWWSLFHAPRSSCSPDLGSHSSWPPCAPWDGNWSLSLSQGSLASRSTLLALPNQRNLQMTADAANFWRPFTSSLNLGEAKLCPKLHPSHAGSLPFRFWEKIPPLWNTAWFLVEQDNLIHCLISSDTKWPFMGARSHGQQWEKVQKRKADALWIHQPQSFIYSLFLGKQGCEVKLSSTENADSPNPIFLDLINGSISGFIWSSLNLGTELTHSARNVIFFFIFLKFFMIMVQKWNLGFPPQPLLTLSLSFFGFFCLFVCLIRG